MNAAFKLAAISAIGVASCGLASQADDAAEKSPPPKQVVCEAPPPGEVGEGWRRLLPDAHAWIDRAGGRVVLDGRVCLREGPLEMFACLEQTKEHESIVSVRTMAFAVHAALVAVGAEAGGVAQFDPEFRPPHGDEIDIFVTWLDDGERRCVRAQDWIRAAESEKTMDHPFVFSGSQLWHDRATGRRRYLAEEGDFICLSNFASAMIDVPFASTDSDGSLLYFANTKAIPPIDTPVRLILSPRRAEENGAKDSAEQPPATP